MSSFYPIFFDDQETGEPAFFGDNEQFTLPVIAVFTIPLSQPMRQSGEGAGLLTLHDEMPAGDGGPDYRRERSYTAQEILEGKCPDAEIVWMQPTK